MNAVEKIHNNNNKSIFFTFEIKIILVMYLTKTDHKVQKQTKTSDMK